MALCAGKARGKGPFFIVNDVECGSAVGKVEGCFERIREARGHVPAHNEAVDDGFDVVRCIFIENDIAIK